MREVERRLVEQFVRDVLGCGCPDEAFLQVEVHPVAEPVGTRLMTRLVIGGRLLVYVAVPAGSAQANAQLLALARHGRRERDALGLNRFRLVLVSYGGNATEAVVREALEGMLEGDDRAHVHVVPRAEVPMPLLPGCAPSRVARVSATAAP